MLVCEICACSFLFRGDNVNCGDVMKEWWFRYARHHIKFSGEVEVHENKFARKRKHHRGSGTGEDVYGVVMVERGSGRVLM